MPSTAEFLKSVKKDQGELPFGYSNLVKRALSLGAEIILHGSPEEYELAKRTHISPFCNTSGVDTTPPDVIKIPRLNHGKAMETITSWIKEKEKGS